MAPSTTARITRKAADHEALNHLNAAVDGSLKPAQAAVLQFYQGRVRAASNGLLASYAERGDAGALDELAEAMRSAARTFYAGPFAVPLTVVAEAGEAYTGVGGAPIAFLVPQEEADPWADHVAGQMRRSLKKVRAELRASKVPLDSEDAVELSRTAVALAPKDGVRMVRMYANTVAKQVPAATLRRAAELLKNRAYLTADFELAKAYNSAKRYKYRQMLDIGLASEVRRTWKTARDEDVCSICGPLHNKTFIARTGRSLYRSFAPGKNKGNPPVHIRCRCTVVYEVVPVGRTEPLLAGVV